MRGERDIILIHNLPHAPAAFGDTVHLDSLPEDLVIPMRLEFFRVFCWEYGVFQALLGSSVITLMRGKDVKQNRDLGAVEENLRMR